MTTTIRHRLAAVLTSLVLLAPLSGCGTLEQYLPEVTSSPAAPAEPAVVAGEMTEDYYTILGTAQLKYDPAAAGTVEYCPLDDLERAVCAYGELTSSSRDAAQARERQNIDVDPAGWPEDNDEVDIPALADVEGSSGYHGWMFNRSHLVADSLGGDAVIENLVAGTRTQNVGSTQIEGEYAGGMAHTERIARQYLDTQNGDACPLYYAATPQYAGDELVPRTVIVDMRSCDGAIDTRVKVFNTAAGWEINYTTGAYTEAT